MSTQASRISLRALAFVATVGAALLIAIPVLAQPVLYNGTMRVIVRTGQVPRQGIVTYGGVLNVTPMDGITVMGGDANFMTTFVVTNPPTFAGVLQQTSFLTVMNPNPGTAKPNNGAAPLTFAYPTPTGSPPVDPVNGVPARKGAAQLVAGPNDFGGVFPFVFNFVANLVFAGGGGGNPNLACPNGVAGVHGAAGTMDFLAQCVGLTTGPLPAQTLPSVMVPQHVTIMFFPAQTGPVFVNAPAPIATTTLTHTGSDVRNLAGTTGMIQLVAPFLFNAQAGGIGNPAGTNNAVAVDEWTLNLMPEPGQLMALVGGIGALAGIRLLEKRRLR